MNAAFLIMSTAALAGADPVPPPPPPVAPVVVSGAGCNNCGAPVSSCCGSSKPGLFDRFKSRMGGFGKKSHGCCAPAPCAPACAPAPCAPACQPAPSCCGSVANRPNLFDTLKSRWGSKKHASVCCDPCASAAVISGPPVGAPPGTTPPLVMPPGTGTTPPKPMPEKPKGGNTSSTPAPLPAVPTVNGAGGNSPY